MIERAVMLADRAESRGALWAAAGRFTERLAVSAGRGRAVPLAWLDDFSGVPAAHLASAEQALSFGPCIAGRQAEVSVTTPAVVRYDFSNAQVHVNSSSVLTSDRLFLERPVAATARRHNLRSGAVVVHGNHFALVRQWPVEHLEAGIFLGGNGSSNYFHWIVDVLPRLGYLENQGLHAMPLLVSDELGKTPTLAQALDLLAPEWDRVLLTHTRLYEVERLIYISSPNTGPFNLRGRHRVRVGDYAFRPSSIAALRDALGNAAAERAGSMRDSPKRVFLMRSEQRRGYNQDEIAACCRARGFTPVSPELLSLKDQIGMFREADMIVGPSGAAWTNIIFARPGSKCLSWLPEIARDFSAYSTLAHLVGVDMRFLTYPTRAKTTDQLYGAGYHLDPDTFQTELDRLLTDP